MEATGAANTDDNAAQHADHVANDDPDGDPDEDADEDEEEEQEEEQSVLVRQNDPALYDTQIGHAVSLPHFAPLHYITDGPFFRALVNKYWSDHADGAHTAVAKSLIVLYQLVNSLQDCWPPIEDLKGIDYMWDIVESVWTVNHFIPGLARPNLAMEAIRTYNNLREIHQLQVKDFLEIVPEPEDRMITLLIRCIHENQTFVRKRDATYRSSSQTLGQLQTERLAGFRHILENKRQELFERVFAVNISHVDRGSLSLSLSLVDLLTRCCQNA